jgi:hypothetical protein
MSAHSEICQFVRVQIEYSLQIDLSPTFLANRIIDHFGKPEEMHVLWLAFEQAKQIARRELAAKFDVDSEDNEVYQGDMFSGMLQQRYPVPVSSGCDPVYRPLDRLSVEELDWNIAKLFKSADARVQHARALQAHRDNVAVRSA